MISSKKKLVVIGQGYVGLPLSMRAADAGFDVVGLDLDENRISLLSEGISFVEDVSNEAVHYHLSNGTYLPTTNYEHAKDFDFAIITVPTPLLEGIPDLSFIESSMKSISSYITTGSTVVLESTTYPGTTEELVVPILEEGSSLTSDVDFFVGYSPERIDPGNQKWNLRNTPKVISGISERSLEKVQQFYSQIVDEVVAVKSPKEAELTKLLENTFRHVNIALVNELAIFGNLLGVDVWEAIEAASTKPFGFMKFTPGPGVGGHCLPVDPSYLSWQVSRKLGHSFRFVDLANDINNHMPDYVVERATTILNNNLLSMSVSRVTIVGLAYKKNSGDIRESPSLRLISLLEERKATIQAVDSYVTELNWPKGVKKIESLEVAIDESDLIILVTDHDTFDFQILSNSKVPVLDTRDRVSGSFVEKL